MSSERFSRIHVLRTALVGLSGALAVLISLTAASEELDAVAKRSWTRTAELPPQERALIDSRSDAPRDPEIPYLPAEQYPFEPPFTGEELAYRMMNFAHNGRRPHTLADAFGSMTKSGYLTQGITVVRMAAIADRGDVPGQLQTAPGDEFLRYALYYTYPPGKQHQQLLWVYRRTDREQSTKIDNFWYLPEMRRVRRMPQFRRDQPLRGNVQTIDDIMGRDAWEFSWRVIGTDVLYETVRFPSTRQELTLASGDGRFFGVSPSELRPMGDEYPFYTKDGGVEALVLVAEPRREWLGNYSDAKLIFWIDKQYFYPLRMEKYDAEGNLKTVQVTMATQGNPELGPEGYRSLLTVYWDARLDLLSYSLHDAYRSVEWSEDEKAVMFSPEFMRRCWLKYAQPTHALVDSVEEFYLRPALDRGKFPEERSIQLAPDVERRIEAQNAAGQLVFAAPDGGP
jgi:hypothetical protein